jgi:methionyl-tRNA formyltransferase
MLKIAFLFDKNNDWILENFPKNFSLNPNYDVHCFYDEKKIKNFDIVFVLSYTKILKGEILNSNKLLLVVHASDLPAGRGFAPMQWQILEGQNTIPICLLEVAEEVDNGDIYKRGLIQLDGTELYDEMRFKQARAIFDLITQFLEEFPECTPTTQVGIPSFYRRRTPDDSRLDPDKTLREQFNLLRVCNNIGWPAFFELDGVEYTLKIEKK